MSSKLDVIPALGQRLRLGAEDQVLRGADAGAERDVLLDRAPARPSPFGRLVRTRRSA